MTFLLALILGVPAIVILSLAKKLIQLVSFIVWFPVLVFKYGFRGAKEIVY